jgi:hypothetical protein
MAGGLPVIGLVLIVALTLLAYWPSLSGASYLFDDHSAIKDNPALRDAGSFRWIYELPPYSTLAGRPFLSWTFGVNALLGGHHPRAYFAGNLLIHLFSVSLVCLVCREALRGRLIDRRTEQIYGLIVAAIWSLHPLGTQAVSYIVQRGEALASLGVLIALTGWILAQKYGRHWLAVSVGGMLVGIASKEIAWFCPLLILLWEWVLKRQSPMQLIRKHPLYFSCAFLTWPLIGVIVWWGGRLELTGFETAYNRWDYFITQPEILFHYLKLVVWPYPQSLDYDWPLVTLQQAWPWILGWTIAFVSVLFLIWKRYLAAIPAALWFLLLSATSSINPLLNLVYEHRVYLASAGVWSIVIGLAFFYVTSVWRKGLTVIFLGVAIVFGFLTFQRATLFQDEWAVWEEALRLNPQHQRALTNLGGLALESGRPREAIRYYRRSLTLGTPEKMAARVYFNLGNAYVDLRDDHSAIPYYRMALQKAPQDPTISANLGLALLRQQQWPEVIDALEGILKQGSLKDPQLAFAVSYAAFKCQEQEKAIYWLRQGESWGGAPPPPLSQFMTEPAPQE